MNKNDNCGAAKCGSKDDKSKKPQAAKTDPQKDKMNKKGDKSGKPK